MNLNNLDENLQTQNFVPTYMKNLEKFKENNVNN